MIKETVAEGETYVRKKTNGKQGKGRRGGGRRTGEHRKCITRGRR